jgi:hypothetical protein
VLTQGTVAVTDLRCNTLADVAGHLTARRDAHDELAARVRRLEKIEDTRGSPLWKRLLFRLDGWPRAGVLAAAPRWRPWRRLWTS